MFKKYIFVLKKKHFCCKFTSFAVPLQWHPSITNKSKKCAVPLGEEINIDLKYLILTLNIDAPRDVPYFIEYGSHTSIVRTFILQFYLNTLFMNKVRLVHVTFAMSLGDYQGLDSNTDRKASALIAMLLPLGI